MKTTMHTAAGTLNQIQRNIDTISHNVANLNTIGYKRREATFQELLVQQLNNQPRAAEEIGRITPNGVRVGSGAKIGQTTLHMGQGSMQTTGRELDFMLEGENMFFRVLKTWENPDTGEQESEILYTRNGNFQLKVDPQNPEQLSLVTAQGYAVLDGFMNRENPLPIEFDQEYSRIEVDERGVMRVYFDNGDFLDYALPVTQISRTDLLEARGESMFAVPNAVLANLAAYGALWNDLDPENLDQNNPAYKVRQGALEMSNVDLTKEMTELIVQQRLLQFHSRAISMADEMLGLANNLRG